MLKTIFALRKKKMALKMQKDVQLRLRISNDLLFQSCLYASNQWVAEIDLQGSLVSYLLLLHFLIPVPAELQHKRRKFN